MLPRQKVFDSYWKLAAERQRIFFRRIANDPSPWTEDPILRNYKFCNTYRASDRVSQYLIRDVIYHGSQSAEDVVFRVLLFRLFNKIETWQYLQARFGGVQISSFDFDAYAAALEDRLASGQSIFGNAFIFCASRAFGFRRKHLNYLALIQRMVQKDRIIHSILSAKSLKGIFALLRSYPLLGNFMAYQLAIDLNYSEVIDFSENDFTIAGVGAKRGIRKCFIDTGGKSDEYIIRWMTEHQTAHFKQLDIDFPSLWGRPLHCIDCQGLFCEIDKYSRVAFPELKSNRKRIKTSFQPNPNHLVYFYPPKWDINDKAAATFTQYRVHEQPTDGQLPSQLTLHLEH